MTSWNRLEKVHHHSLLPYKVELRHDQWYGLRLHDAGDYFIWPAKDVAEAIQSNLGFNEYVVGRASVSGCISSSRWHLVCLIVGPNKGRFACARDVMYFDLEGNITEPAIERYPNGIAVAKNIRFVDWADWKDAKINIDFKVYISFNTKSEAMLFKLIFG